jgi:hypothetical protein
MAIAVALETGQEMGRILAEAASQDPVVEGLWVSADHNGVHLWLVTPRSTRRRRTVSMG